MSTILKASLLCILTAACGMPPLNTAKKATPTPALSPTPADAVRIEKATNVSFSTYSKDWPVGWQWVDPDEKYAPTPKDVRSGVLRVKIPTGKDLYGDNRSAPRYIKPLTGDFQIETRVKFLPKENYQGAGLFIFLNDNNYIRFERAYGGIGGGADGIRIDHRTETEYKPIVTAAELQTEAGEVDLKIVRAGQVFSAYWRTGKEAAWREAAVIETDYGETIFAGLVACNTAREVTAEFAYIKLLPGIPAK